MREEMLKLLSPSAIDIGNPGGGYASLTSADVSAALSGLSRGPYSLGMIVHAHDDKSFYALYVAMLGEIKAPDTPVSLRGSAPTRELLWVALCELFLDKWCRVCGGTGLIRDDKSESVHRCGVCNEKLTKTYTDMSRARQAKIPYEIWKPIYRDYYNQLISKLLDWDSRVQPHITRRYGG